MSETQAIIALTRFGLGVRPGDIAAIAGDPRAALRTEIADRDAARLDGEGLPDTVAALTAVHELREMRQAAKAAKPAAGAAKPMREAYGLREELPARLKRIGEARIGYAERLAGFWANHFAIALDSGQVVRGLAGAYEREAIRPHVLGKFGDLLLAATSHPAMLTYLNNATSIGPDSPAGQKRERGLNENHAREILELHTLGVGSGYSQADVTSFARILTGWSFGQNPDEPKSFGAFRFQARAHEPGTQRLLGADFAQAGVAQGEAALAMLAIHPATASHIATKLARHFVADDPPPALVNRLSERFLASGGDLQQVAMALIESDEAWSAPPAKLRSPQDFVWASLRALAVKPKPQQVQRALATLGQPLFNPPSPAGFADDLKTWLAPDAMTNRLDIAELLSLGADAAIDPRRLAEAVLGPRLSPATAEAVARAESQSQGLALLLMSPEFQRR